jgi:precorrin-6B methylase 2
MCVDAASTDSRGPAPGELRPDTVLRRVPDVAFTLSAADTVEVRTAVGSVTVGYLGLRVLEGFRVPTSLAEFARRGATGAQEWVDLLSTVVTLVRHGVLIDVARNAVPEGTTATPRYWWDDPRPHIQMLDDEVRTAAYIAAIEQVVSPGDVVVDIGTGTGVLAMAAARAGAARVYAIEAGAIAGRAREVIARNGLADRVQVIRGWSSAVELPERGDVLVTETLGSDPFDERILETVLDARDRLLTDEARIIPRSVELHASPVEVPDEVIADRVFSAVRAGAWTRSYGFDFTALAEYERDVPNLRVTMRTASRFRRLAPPVRLAGVDLRAVASSIVSGRATAAVESAGRLDGAVLHFEAELADEIRLSTDPATSPQPRNWWSVLSLRSPIAVAVGDELELRYGWRSPTVARGLAVSPSNR